MGRQISRTNYALISGIAISDFQKEREAYGRNQYVSGIEVRRLSGRTDRIPVMAPAKLLEDAAGCKGQYVCVAGRYHSMNYYDGKKRRVKLFVYAGALAVQAEDGGMCDRNYIFLDGYICAGSQSSARLRLGAQLRICWLPSTAFLGFQITFHASVGKAQPI